ncbi:LLM class flavin-dependent oxidoreductase [Halomicrococcus sp. NG-SE-24]|uniref:LLM class flavin-dependent oxidoreductase n=1 Tax=Halomicrococcus sp. NG-SE-24 TaxID=3436928 RepID=UPI003D98F3E6
MVPTFPGKGVHRDAPLYEQLDWHRTKGGIVLAEQLGYDGFWAPDHFTLGVDEAELEVWTVLSTIAGMTETGALGPLVSAVLYRNPALLGKMATTLDVTSNGRAVLGIGAGWHEEEHRAYGYEFPPIDERIERLDEAIRLIKAMWNDNPASFEGDYYQINAVTNNPPPVQDPHPPILIGGGGPEMLRLVARHADVWNVEITARNRGPPTEEKIEHLERYLEAENRSPDDVEYSWLGHCLIADSERRVEELLDRILPIPSASPDQEFELTTADEARERGDYFIGTPTEVAEQIEAVADMGFERFQLMFVDYPSLDGLGLFADEVMTEM